MCPPPGSGDANAHASRHQVVVIGGGIAGLTAVKVCQDHGIDAHAFERTELLGGVWNHTYKNVRLQQHKDDFRLSGTEWHPGVKDFPTPKPWRRTSANSSTSTTCAGEFRSASRLSPRRARRRPLP